MVMYFPPLFQIYVHYLRAMPFLVVCFLVALTMKYYIVLIISTEKT